MTLKTPAGVERQQKKLTTGEVAYLFGVHLATVRKWADEGKLQHTRTLGRDRRFDRAYILGLLAGDDDDA